MDQKNTCFLPSDPSESKRSALLVSGLIALLPIEVLAVGIFFNIQLIIRQGLWWTASLNDASHWFQLIPTVFAILVLVAASLRQIGKPAMLLALHPWLCIHSLAFAAFVVLSTHLEMTLDQSTENKRATEMILIWVMLIPGFVLPWIRIFYPFRQWGTVLSQSKHTLAAAILVAFIAWLGSWSTQNLWHDFHLTTFRVVHLLLLSTYPKVVVDNERFIIGTSDYLAVISKDCSGYEGMGLVSIFLAFYLWMFRRELRFPHALFILPISLSVIWVFNAFRISILIAIGSSWSPDIAERGFHSQAGWISFLLVAFASMWLLGKSQFFSISRKQASFADTPFPEPNADALIFPFLVLLAGGMLTTAFSDDGGYFSYPVKILATGLSLWFFRKNYRNLSWQPSLHPLLVGIAVFVFWFFLEPATMTTEVRPPWLYRLPEPLIYSWLLLRTLGSVLVIPMAEELFFRSYLLRKLVNTQFHKVDPQRFTWFSFLASSLLFGLLHQRWLAGTIAGMGFAYAVYRHGRLSDVLIAHMTANALIAVSVLCFGHWQLWS